MTVSPVVKEEVLENIAEARRILDEMLDELIPSTIEEAMTAENLGYATRLAEMGIEFVSPWEQREWRQRAISIESANRILVTFENRCVHLFVQDQTHVVATALSAPFAWITYLIENEGKIVIFLSELAAHVARAIQGRFLEESIKEWEIRDKLLMDFEFRKAWQRLAEQHTLNEELVIEIIRTTEETVERFFTEMVWEQIGPMVLLFSGGAATVTAVRPVAEAFRHGGGSARKSAFPQVNRSRYRRRKRVRA